jgi:hypothetical protein
MTSVHGTDGIDETHGGFQKLYVVCFSNSTIVDPEAESYSRRGVPKLRRSCVTASVFMSVAKKRRARVVAAAAHSRRLIRADF